MYKIYSNLLFLILLIFLINCSFGPGKRVWNDLSKDLETVKNTENTKLIFSTSQKFNEEITSNKKLVINSKPLKNSNWNQQNLSNGNYPGNFIDVYSNFGFQICFHCFLVSQYLIIFFHFSKNK